MTHVAIFEGSFGGASGKRRGSRVNAGKSISGSTSPIELDGSQWAALVLSRSRAYKRPMLSRNVQIFSILSNRLSRAAEGRE